MLVLGYYHYRYERNETNIFRTRRFYRMLYQIKTGIPFNINQSFLTTMYSIVMLCSMLIQELFFGIIFQRQFTCFYFTYESSCTTIFAEFLAKLRNEFALTSIRVHEHESTWSNYLFSVGLFYKCSFREYKIKLKI